MKQEGKSDIVGKACVVQTQDGSCYLARVRGLMLDAPILYWTGADATLQTQCEISWALAHRATQNHKVHILV